MNDPIKRIEELERDNKQFKHEVNENLTMMIGQNWRTGETLRLFRSETSDRLTRIDDRVDGLHRDMAEQLLQIKDLGERVNALSKDVTELKSTQAEQSQKLDQILTLLQQKSNQ